MSVTESGQNARGRPWYEKLLLRSKDLANQPEVAERLTKLERAVELRTLDGPQAGVDKDQAEAAATLIHSLENVTNGILQIGSLVVVKNTDDSGRASVLARTLTNSEMMALQDEKQACSVLARTLNAAVSIQNVLGGQPHASNRSSTSGHRLTESRPDGDGP